MSLLIFVAGLMIGTAAGVFVMCLMAVSGMQQADQEPGHRHVA